MNDSAQILSPDSLIDGRFRVVRLLGQGGMGAVYEARNTLKRRFAIKVMRPEVARNAEYARRFLQEAQAASALAHPNIVDVLEIGEDAALGAPYIVQEFLTGHDLRTHLEASGQMPLSEVLALIVPVMEALVMAHGRGIVHRDLKPDNIFLAETARGVVPKLIDFGIAKVVGEDGGSLQMTCTGMMLGTPYYMSPEHARGDSDLDARADVWALGVVLYEMLSGKRPYEAPNGNILIGRILHEDPTPLAQAAPDLPADLIEVVMGALRRDRTTRHPTMQAFLDLLCGCQTYRDAAPAAPMLRASGASFATPVPTPPITATTPITATPPPAPARAPEADTCAPRVETLPPDDAIVRPAPGRKAWAMVAGGVVALGLALSLVGSTRAPAHATRAASTTASLVVPITPVAVDTTPVAHEERPRLDGSTPTAAVATPVAVASVAAPVHGPMLVASNGHRARQRPAAVAAPQPARVRQSAASSSSLTGIPILPP